MKSIPHYDCDFIRRVHSNATLSLHQNETTWTCCLYSSIKQLCDYKFKALKKALFDFESLCSGDGIADEVGCKYVKGQIVSSDPPVHKVMRKAMLPL